jgi:hypothetical protein
MVSRDVEHVDSIFGMQEQCEVHMMTTSENGH